MRPWIYQPDELVDMGLLGRHAITLTAAVETTHDPQTRKNLLITSAVVHVVIGDHVQDIDVTVAIIRDSYARRMWEDEILEDYEKCQSAEKDWEPNDAA